MTSTVTFVLVLLCCHYTAGQECSSDEIRCKDSTRCIPLRYICDSDNDCGDNSDEDGDLCAVWRSETCERGSYNCERFGDASCVSIQEYCEASSPPCTGALDPRVCQILRDGEIQNFSSVTVSGATTNLNKSKIRGEELKHIVNFTLSHPACPPLFTLVGDQCLSILFVNNVTWGEARHLCQFIGGDLITFRNVSHFASVIQHLKETKLTADFWAGGHYVNSEWSWLDGSPMEHGSPFWTVKYSDVCRYRHVTSGLNITRRVNGGSCYRYYQAPGEFPVGECVALTYQHFYYMSDEDCLHRKSPLCVARDRD